VLPVVTASAWRPREQGSAYFNVARKRLGAPRRIAARSNETARRLHPAANSATLGVHSLLPFIKMKRVAEAAPRVLAVCDVELVHAVAKALVEAGLTDGSQSAVVIPTTGSAVTGEEHPYFGSVFHADVRPARDYDREYLGRQVGGRKYDFALVACPEALVPFMDGSCRGTEQGSEASSAESRSGASLSPGTDRLVSIASHLLSDGVMCIVLRSPDPEGSSFAPAGSTDILAHDDAFFATFERTVSRDISRVGEVGLRLSHVDRYARTEHFPGDELELTPDEMKREEHVYVYERT